MVKLSPLFVSTQGLANTHTLRVRTRKLHVTRATLHVTRARFTTVLVMALVTRMGRHGAAGTSGVLVAAMRLGTSVLKCHLGVAHVSVLQD